MTQDSNLNTPWSLHFDHDGTEDVAIICDGSREDLVRSRHFWLPEGDDPVPATLASMWLMTAAPKLLDALNYLLEQTVDMDLEYGVALTEGEQDARNKALATIAEATTGKSPAESRKPIVIEVRGGVVTAVLNLPPDCEYEIKDLADPNAADASLTED